MMRKEDAKVLMPRLEIPKCLRREVQRKGQRAKVVGLRAEGGGASLPRPSQGFSVCSLVHMMVRSLVLCTLKSEDSAMF